MTNQTDIVPRTDNGNQKTENSSSNFSKNLFINFRKNDEKVALKKAPLETTVVVINKQQTKPNSGRSIRKLRSNSAVFNSKKNVAVSTKVKSTEILASAPAPSTAATTITDSSTPTTTVAIANKKAAEITCRQYTDEAKYIYVKTWLDEVERVHSVEGKCLETINKVTFYD